MGREMKIDELLIANFRGISRLEAQNLGDTIIIAGQNGSGKSCIFDAIRLLKSTIGGYQQNEWQHFFGEFQIQLTGGAKNMRGLFNEPGKPVHIRARFRLRDSERKFINDNAADLLEQTIWQTLLPEAFQWGGYRKALFANQFRERMPEVKGRVQSELPELQKEIANDNMLAEVIVNPDGALQVSSARLLQVAFSNYRPRDIGVIDFHGAQRHYGREQLQGVNLNLDQNSQAQGQHAIYNYNNKYNNVKSEMAGNFIRELLAEKAHSPSTLESKSLSATLKELFESFFPEKKFLGPQPTPDGSLAFPVQTENGSTHDLDELSSGEKEILYGYLRIRSSAPKDSIILLDEPELHLNPRLIRGLPEFYRKHLGEALHNQLWLVTHSDALIREAVGKPGFNVFHMVPCSVENGTKSQLKPLEVQGDLDTVLTDLIGDLAAYRPGGKCLIFEGGGDSDFDKTFVGALFAEELAGVNLISGSNKARVRALHEVLEQAYHKGDLPTKYFAVVDKDTSTPEEVGKAVSWFMWDVYHIENYLLVPDLILSVLKALNVKSLNSPAEVQSALSNSARMIVQPLINHRLRQYANSILLRSINLGFDPTSNNADQELHDALVRSVDRIGEKLGGELDLRSLNQKKIEFEAEYANAFTDDSWIRVLPGREILKHFTSSNGIPVNHEVLRSLISSRLIENGTKPDGMRQIVEKIRNS
jgi:predicted ATPase